MTFYRDFTFEYGRPQQLAPGVTRIVANNPKDYTWVGTNTYLIGQRDLAILDPGPALAGHVEAVMAAVAGRPVRAILVTHSHLDHSAAAPILAARTGAPVYAHSVIDPQVAQASQEDIDTAFRPDRDLACGDWVNGSDWRLEAVHTPGHFPNHLCFALGEHLFSGDHVMGWSTTAICPPLGDLADYLGALEKLLARGFARYLPSHGPAIPDPEAYVRALIQHRHSRTQAILACLEQGVSDPAAIVQAIYKEDHLSPRLMKAAQGSVRAHLDYLARRSADRVAAE
ncbi:MAG: MBL fold metallo-hydrolase [Rhodothalassiaceae bacterium]